MNRLLDRTGLDRNGSCHEEAESSCIVARAGTAWWVSVLLHPTKREAERGKLSRFVVQPTAIIACNRDDAALAAARMVPKEFDDVRSRLEVCAHEFC